MAEIMNDAQEEVTEEIAAASVVWLLGEFANRWAEDEEIMASAASDMRELARRRYAIPVGMGAMIALIRYSWETAPPGSTAEQLAAHVAKTGYEATMAVLAEGRPAGDFWTHLVEELAGDR